MWQNTWRYENERFMFPVFKFSELEHTKNLLERGQVHVSTLHEFRDPEKYEVAGTIHDKGEGIFKITNKYSKYFGKAKDGYGLLRREAPPEKELKLIECTFQENIKVNDCLIYCTAEHFFSETLNWALKNGKNSCAMIVDLEMFIDYVTQWIHPDYLFVNLQSCIYDGREIDEVDTNENSETERFLKNPFNRLFFSKPNQIEYKEQFEVRAVWQHSRKDNVTPIESKSRTVEIPDLRGFVFPVDFSGITLESIEKQRKGIGAFGVQIVRSDKIANYCIFDFPKDILSPVCCLTKEGWVLGVRNVGTERTFRDGIIVAAETQIAPNGGIGPLLLITKLNEVRLVKFFYEENYQEKLKEMRSKMKKKGTQKSE